MRDLAEAGDVETASEAAPGRAVRAAESCERDHEKADARDARKYGGEAGQRPQQRRRRDDRERSGADREHAEPTVVGAASRQGAHVVARLAVPRVRGADEKDEAPEDGETAEDDTSGPHRDESARSRDAVGAVNRLLQRRMRR
jgi:hypothetical protein